ncbi:MAG: N-acetylmuramoyl-L-alanine amidase [Bacteroidota bacterium]
MKTLVPYLLQLIVISGILYCYYHFFLRNRKFHGYNRFYLLFSFVLSIGIPFLNIPVYFETKDLTSPSLFKALTNIKTGGFEENLSVVKSPLIDTASLNWSALLLVIYSATLLLMTARFIISITKIFRLKNRFPVEKIGNIDFIICDEPSTPFSFFRNLFWNKKIPLDSQEGLQILKHECYHIQRNHSYDILFAEIVTLIFWMNPLFFLLKKEIKTIHEFLADQFAVTADEEWNYAELLLMQLLGSPTQRLTNPFFHNQIKRRIAMITTSKKPGHQYLRKLLVLPIAAVITAAFAFKYETKSKETPSILSLDKTVTVVIDAGHGESDPGAKAADGTKESDLTLQIAQKIKQLNKNDRIHVVLTRNSKETVDLRKRSDIANAQNPDLFISLHANAAEKVTDESGFEVYISKKNPTYYAENKILGTILLNYFTSIYKTNDKIQQQDQGIWVLDNSKCPSALVEFGYLSNKQDLEFMKNPSNQNKIAESILNSIEQFAREKKKPDFSIKKQFLGDTTIPDIQLMKDAAGNFSATFNNLPITKFFFDPANNLAGVTLNDNSNRLISKEQVKLLQDKYPNIWYDFINDFAITPEKNKNQNSNKSSNPLFIINTETDPVFPGGEHAWTEYLQKNLNANVPIDNNAPAGSYTVWVEFSVGTDGTVSNVKTLTSHGFGMEQEVIKLFAKGHKWLPAIQDGKKIAAYKKQPVTFVVQEEKISR